MEAEPASASKRFSSGPRSSETASQEMTSQPSARHRSATLGPERSWRSPRETESLTVTTATRISLPSLGDSDLIGRGKNPSDCHSEVAAATAAADDEESLFLPFLLLPTEMSTSRKG